MPSLWNDVKANFPSQLTLAHQVSYQIKSPHICMNSASRMLTLSVPYGRCDIMMAHRQLHLNGKFLSQHYDYSWAPLECLILFKLNLLCSNKSAKLVFLILNTGNCPIFNTYHYEILTPAVRLTYQTATL